MGATGSLIVIVRTVCTRGATSGREKKVEDDIRKTRWPPSQARHDLLHHILTLDKHEATQ